MGNPDLRQLSAVRAATLGLHKEGNNTIESQELRGIGLTEQKTHLGHLHKPLRMTTAYAY